MTAWAEGRRIGIDQRAAEEQRRANEEQQRANEEQRRQWMLTNGAVEDGSGDYAYGQGSYGKLNQQIVGQMINENNNLIKGTNNQGDANQQRKQKLQNLQKQQDRALEADGHQVYGASDNPEQQEIDIQKQQIAAQGQQIQQMQGQMSVAASDNGLLEFMEYGDANAIQQSLRNNPNLGEAWAGQGGQHVSNIDLVNDAHLLDSIGLTPDMMAYEELTNLVKNNIYKVWDGEKYVAASAEQLVKETGVLGRVTPSKAAVMIAQLGQFHAAKNGVLIDIEERKQTTAEAVAAETGRSNVANEALDAEGHRIDAMGEATNRANSVETGRSNVANEALDAEGHRIDAMGEATNRANSVETGRSNVANEALDAEGYRIDAMGEATNRANSVETGRSNVANEALDAEGYRIDAMQLAEDKRQFDLEQKNPPSTDEPEKYRQWKVSNDLKDQGIAVVGTLDDYLNTEFNLVDQQYFEVESYVNGVEHMLGLKPSEEDKVKIASLKKVGVLGSQAAKLGQKNTGFLSDTADDVLTYAWDNIDGLVASTSWELLNNVLLRYDGGKVLSEGEIKYHKASHGSLKMQWSPVLIGLRTSLQAKLVDAQSLKASAGVFPGHFRYGATINGLTKTIKLITNLLEKDYELEKNKSPADVKSAGGGNRGVSDSSMASILARAKAK